MKPASEDVSVIKRVNSDNSGNSAQNGLKKQLTESNKIKAPSSEEAADGKANESKDKATSGEQIEESSQRSIVVSDD